VPLVVGDATPHDVAHVLRRLCGPETLIVVSSDLALSALSDLKSSFGP
jgi:hypothetical protein